MTTMTARTGHDREERIELVRTDRRTVRGVTLQYRMYRLRNAFLDGYAIEADGPDGKSPLYFFDHYAVRAEAFYAQLVKFAVFPCMLGEILTDACGDFVAFPSPKNPDCSLQIAKNMIK